jgi:hypothetical protein
LHPRLILILDNKNSVVSGVAIPQRIALNALMVHPARATKVTRGIEAGNGGMKDMDLAAEIDPIFDIIWDWAIRVSHGIEERLEFRWEEGFVDVLRQFVEAFWISSFWKERRSQYICNKHWS